MGFLLTGLSAPLLTTPVDATFRVIRYVTEVRADYPGVMAESHYSQAFLATVKSRSPRAMVKGFVLTTQSRGHSRACELGSFLVFITLA